MIEDTEIGGGEDTVVWAPAANGRFNLSDTYEFLRKKKQPWPWSDLVWFKNRINRHSFVAWIALRNGLKTLSMLKKWGTVQSDVCVQCWREEETEEHLLYE